MVFAHTIVEAPKYGASRRAAAISAPRLAAPTTKTTSSSGGRRIGPRVRRPFRPKLALACPSVTTAELAALDRQVLWHPFTQQEGWEQEEQVVIERAEGVTRYDPDGNAYIDGVSAPWVNVHGHRHHASDAAIRHQLERVAHSTMLGL